MKKIAFFCIPAHGHTNPMLPVAAELVRRGDAVRFYSFDEFEAKIKATGAEFVSCTRFLPEMTKEEEEAVKNISTTEMTIQDIKITIQMNDFLEEEFKTFQPDVIISCGNSLDQKLLGELPPNVQVYPYVDQLDVLSRADAFITHCGMNSVSESLYMAAPMVLYPQTSEQNAVARKTKEIGAGVLRRLPFLLGHGWCCGLH